MFRFEHAGFLLRLVLSVQSAYLPSERSRGDKEYLATCVDALLGYFAHRRGLWQVHKVVALFFCRRKNLHSLRCWTPHHVKWPALAKPWSQKWGSRVT